MSVPEWNARYLHYARVNGEDPDSMLKRDERAFPGGKMAGFMCWIDARWLEWKSTKGMPRMGYLTPEDVTEFDAWLAALPTEGK